MSTIAPANAQLPAVSQGRRYTAAERDAAFLVYCGAGRQNFVATANLTRINRNTLAEWASQDDWHSRLDTAGTAAETAVAVVRAMFPYLLTAAAERWLTILTDDKGNQNAQVRLIELTYGMYGMVMPKHSVSVVQHIGGEGQAVTVSMRDLASLGPDELAAWKGEQDHDDDTEGGEVG